MAITNKTIIDNVLTSEQSAKIGLEALTNKVDDDLGGVYNSSARKNTSLKNSFSGYSKTIVNAINDLDDRNIAIESSILNLTNLINNTIGDIQSADIEEANKKLQAIFGNKPIVTGLLDYYTNGLGFNSTSFKGLYKEYTQAELDNGAVDLIPLDSILNPGDIIKDETGTYYKISEPALVNDGAGAKPTIEDWKAAGIIEDMSIPDQGDINLNGILYRGEYTVGESYTKNDLFYKDDIFYLVIKNGSAPADFQDFEEYVKAFGGQINDPTLPGITYEEII